MKGTHQQQLKKAIQEQLDLILRIEQDRKNLKKQNKSLNQKYIKATQALKKYNNIQKLDQNVQTCLSIDLIQKMENKLEALQEENIKQQTTNLKDSGCQTDLNYEQRNMNISIQNKKLNQAMSFLKGIDTSMQSQIQKQYQYNTSKYTQQQNMTNNTLNINQNTIFQNQSLKKNSDIGMKKNKQQDKSKQQDKNNQISNEVLKMSKQIIMLKREIKQSDSRYKQSQKQLKEVKKCLQTKNQLLQKTRKQFNQLSMLLNNDKYKSIRILQSENQRLKQKGGKMDEQQQMITQLKEMLQSVANEYKEYQSDKQKKVFSLKKQLIEKGQEIEKLQIEVGRYKNQLDIIKG